MSLELFTGMAHSWGLVVVILVMVALFVTERLPVDVTAMAVLVVLLIGKYVTTEEAFSGFSSPVVIVMVSTLFVAGALRVTGVADSTAKWIRHYAGTTVQVALGIGVLTWIFVINPINTVFRHQYDIGADFSSSESGSSIR
jgi:di/tricarboxylate transporter